MTVRGIISLSLGLAFSAGFGFTAEIKTADESVRTHPAEPAKSPRDYAERAEKELRGNILPFWIAHTIDREHGGFYGEISNDLVVRKGVPRGALLSCRILWTYSAAYRLYHDAAYLEMAQWAYRDLAEHFWDKENGGFFWAIKADGEPLRTEKQVYGEAFGIYALSEYYRATHEAGALESAKKIYQLLEEHARDPKFGGYWEIFTQDWKRGSMRESVTNEGAGTKSQNTHLHVLEAYTNLLRAWPDDGLRKTQTELIGLMQNKILDPKTHHLILFLKDDWTPVSDGISFGHDIEASWLLTEAAEVVGNEALKAAVRRTSLDVARVTLAEGVASDGSLLYEADPKGITDDRREWWPEAEAAVGFYNAYQLSGEEKYRTAAYAVWDYIDANIVDHTHGEWFRAVMKDGRKSREPKVSMWKCPYHNGRSCMELMERMDAMAKK